MCEPETTEHILWSCWSSQAVWQEQSRKIQKMSFRGGRWYGMDAESLREKLDEEFAQAMGVARLIWLRRNSFIF
jgi:hypothetical protein